MYLRKIIPVNELINYLQEKIGELQALGEDEIVSADIEVITTENVISDIIYDREYKEGYENLDECLRTIPPHVLLEYVHYPKEDAKTDRYWDNFQEIRNDIWNDEIYSRIKDRLKEKTEKKEEEKEELEEIVFSDLD